MVIPNQGIGYPNYPYNNTGGGGGTIAPTIVNGNVESGWPSGMGTSAGTLNVVPGNGEGFGNGLGGAPGTDDGADNRACGPADTTAVAAVAKPTVDPAIASKVVVGLVDRRCVAVPGDPRFKES